MVTVKGIKYKGSPHLSFDEQPSHQNHMIGGLAQTCHAVKDCSEEAFIHNVHKDATTSFNVIMPLQLHSKCQICLHFRIVLMLEACSPSGWVAMQHHLSTFQTLSSHQQLDHKQVDVYSLG